MKKPDRVEKWQRWFSCHHEWIVDDLISDPRTGAPAVRMTSPEPAIMDCCPTVETVLGDNLVWTFQGYVRPDVVLPGQRWRAFTYKDVAPTEVEIVDRDLLPGWATGNSVAVAKKIDGSPGIITIADQEDLLTYLGMAPPQGDAGAKEAASPSRDEGTAAAKTATSQPAVALVGIYSTKPESAAMSEEIDNLYRGMTLVGPNLPKAVISDRTSIHVLQLRPGRSTHCAHAEDNVAPASGDGRICGACGDYVRRKGDGWESTGASAWDEMQPPVMVDGKPLSVAEQAIWDACALQATVAMPEAATDATAAKRGCEIADALIAERRRRQHKQ